MSEKVKKNKEKVKKIFAKKNWYAVMAPKIFNFSEIGEIIGLENTILDRTIECLYYDFTNNYRDINLKLKFRVVTINEEAKTCSSIFNGHEFTNDYVRSLIGRGSTKISTILNLETKDNYIFRVTAICITIQRARSSQQIIIRKIMREILKEFAKSLNHEKFIQGMIGGEFQAQIKRVAKTIYPLSNSAVTKSKLISIPQGGADQEVPDNEFEIVDVEVKRSRKSDIKRSERINVKKYPNKRQSNRPQQTRQTRRS